MYLYLNNFRGFSKQFIPVLKTNFLVGENSTGKSSIIGLINLLSDQRFWYEQIFASNDVNFSHYEDLASIYSDDRSHFDIGYFDLKKIVVRKKPRFRCRGLLLRYIDLDGSPKLKEFFYCDESHSLHVVFDNTFNSKFKYSLQKIKTPTSENDIKNRIFKKWIKNKGGHEDYDECNNRYYKLRIKNSSKVSITEILNCVDLELMELTNSDEDLSYLYPNLYSDIACLAPIRTKPRRTYDEYKYDFSPEGEHTPYVIKRILKKKSDRDKFIKFVKQVGKNSGLFENISTKDFGSTPSSPFELDIILSKKKLSINNVGYGVSQALPIVVEIFSRPDGCCVIIQQPEVHLHPKAQAAIGNIIYEVGVKDDKDFIIETHSDYMIDRYRVCLRKDKRLHKPSSQILFFERSSLGNKVTPLEIDSNGNLPKIIPKKYKEFFIKEELSILGLD